LNDSGGGGGGQTGCGGGCNHGREGTLYYRESVGLGTEFDATTGGGAAGRNPPRVSTALHEVGVERTTTFAVDSGGGGGGKFSPLSAAHSRNSANGGGGEFSAGVASFRWSEDHAHERAAAFPHWKSTPSLTARTRTAGSVIGAGREARHEEARGTDPFTQKITSPAKPIDPDTYRTLRKVMPGDVDIPGSQGQGRTQTWSSQRRTSGGGQMKIPNGAQTQGTWERDMAPKTPPLSSFIGAV